MADNLLQLEAGMQPRAQLHTILVGRSFYWAHWNHRKEINWKEWACGVLVARFPESLPLIFMACAIWVFVIWHPCFLWTINQWCACEYVGKKGAGERVLKWMLTSCIFYTKWSLSRKTSASMEVWEESLQWFLSLPGPHNMKIQQCSFFTHCPAGKTLLSPFFSLQALSGKIKCLFAFYVHFVTTSKVRFCLLFLSLFSQLLQQPKENY